MGALNRRERACARPAFVSSSALDFCTQYEAIETRESEQDMSKTAEEMSATTKRTRLQRTLGEARSMLRDLSTNCAAMEEPEIVEELGETIEELIAALCEISDAHPVDVLAAFSADDISEMIR